MKKIISFLLVLCMTITLTAPAFAMEDELTAVTLAVKEALEISDDYTDYSGSYSDGIPPCWYLYWTKDGESLSVTASEEGKVLELYKWVDSGKYDRFSGFDAAFPELDETAASQEAERVLSRIMGAGETARMDDCSVSLGREGSYTFYGNILMNGLESPVSFSMTVGKDGVTYYYRSDSYTPYTGDVPEPTAVISEEDAAAALRERMGFELYYVSDGEKQAALRYVPVNADVFVDAQTGDVVDMASSDGIYYRDTPMEAAAAEMDMAAGLTEVEQEAVDAYEGVLNREALDAAVRALPNVGLESFGYSRCDYSMDEDGVITASLRYEAPMTEQNLFGFDLDTYYSYQWDRAELTVCKYMTVDAVTGELLSLWTSYPLWKEGEETGTDGADAAAEFLAAAAPEKYACTARCNVAGYGDRLAWAREENGYLFPENRLTVTMNEATGTVDSYESVWDDEMSFAPAEGIVDAETAQSSYIEALTLTLGYASVPLEEQLWDYTTVYHLMLGYYFSGREALSGVDALTGETVTDNGQSGEFSYDDIEGLSQAAAIEKLADAGIGFGGGSFFPKKALTMADAVTLLVQADGSDPANWDEDTLRQQAVWSGFVTESEWDADRELTRMEFIRMVLRASRYGAAAELAGIWDEAFSDVADADQGYAAIAYGLGMAEGDPFVPDVTCTRAAAAVALCRFMER